MYLSSLYLRHLRSAIQKYQLIFLFFFYIVFYNFWEAIYIISFFLLSLSFSSSLVWFKLPQPIKKDTFKIYLKVIKKIYIRQINEKKITIHERHRIDRISNTRTLSRSVYHSISFSLFNTLLILFTQQFSFFKTTRKKPQRFRVANSQEILQHRLIMFFLLASVKFLMTSRGQITGLSRHAQTLIHERSPGHTICGEEKGIRY